MRIDLLGRGRDSCNGEVHSKQRKDLSPDSCHFNCLVMHSMSQILRCLNWSKVQIGSSRSRHQHTKDSNDPEAVEDPT
jgi:hypothetical protein